MKFFLFATLLLIGPSLFADEKMDSKDDQNCCETCDKSLHCLQPRVEGKTTETRPKPKQGNDNPTGKSE
jgi:hypothetical protein